MKISLFIPSLRGGGAERMFLNLANSLASEGLDIDLLLAKAEGPYLSDVSGKVNVIDCGKQRVLYCLPILLKYMRRNKPDVLFSAMNHANLIALTAYLLSGKDDTKIYVSIRNTLSKIFGKRGVRKVLFLKGMKWLYSKADKIITVSDGVAEDFKELLKIDSGKIQTIYNPVINDELIKKAEEEIDHPWFREGCPPVILGAGRLTEQKDFNSLIRAFAIVNKRHDARLVILGEGEERQQLESLVIRLGLSRKVDLPGFVNNPFKYMKRADVFVLSSRWEGLPGVLIQAMACGVPVVSTDCPSGPREILNNGEYGELIPVGDTKRLAEGILNSLKNKRKNFSNENLCVFKEDTVIQEFYEIL